jgi:hypothetical protein
LHIPNIRKHLWVSSPEIGFSQYFLIKHPGVNMKKIAIVMLAGAALLSGCVAYPVNDGRGDNRSASRDRDRDGIPNRMDRDRDGDGVRNSQDRRPDDPRRY